MNKDLETEPKNISHGPTLFPEVEIKNYNLNGVLDPEEIEVPRADYEGRKVSAWQASRDSERKLHSFEGRPALVRADGTQEWYEHGKLHRDDNLPARIKPDGTVEYWKHGSSYFLSSTQPRPASVSVQAPTESSGGNRAERRRKRKRRR